MKAFRSFILCSVLLSAVACGGGNEADPVKHDAASPVLDDIVLNPLSQLASYSVLIQNYWSREAFPQGYPDDAHLSLIGGAVHNAAVSFWSLGEPPSPGVEDLAETGRIDILLADEVQPAVLNGTADSSVSVLTYTDAPDENGPGELTFAVRFKINYPLLSLVTMLGPSPDWFVGIDSLSLQKEGRWIENLSVELPLLDAGSKSNMTPVMHGPGISPPNPIAYVAYDEATGVYLPADEPQIVARLVFTRMQ